MPAQDKPKTIYRIGVIGSIGFIGLALIADLFTLIPFVGDVVGPIFWVGASFYLYFKGFGFVNGRRLATSAISLVGELIPAIQELPLILAGAIAIIVLARIEDRTGLHLHKNGVVDQEAWRKSLNHNGRREPLPEAATVGGLDGVSSKTNLRPLNMDGVRVPSKAQSK